MTDDAKAKYLVAVVGAGPAGLFAAKQLASEGVRVVIFNRDIKPGGLAEYGIYPDKIKMKEGLRSQFRQVLDLPLVTYLGNVTVGENGDFTLDDLRAMGFQAILVTAGAQGTKWLGLPGEDLEGVYHAKEIIYHYNRLPPYALKPYIIGKRVALIGAGNVMMDLAHWLTEKMRVDEVVAVIRRGPNEVKFDRKELEYVAGYIDLQDLGCEIERLTPLMESLNQDPEQLLETVKTALQKASPRISDTRLTFTFLASPSRILPSSPGSLPPGSRAAGLEVENNTLMLKNGEIKPQGLGTFRTLNVDTVIFAIGDRVDDAFGLPVEGNEFMKCDTPRYPVEGISYEALCGPTREPDDVFVAGWARKASTGLVGIARKDGINGAKAIAQFLQAERQPLEPVSLDAVEDALNRLPHPAVTREDLTRLEAVERARSEARGEEFKFDDSDQMLMAMGLKSTARSR